MRCSFRCVDIGLGFAVVPGPTPFLLSSTFLKQIRAVIDTDEGTMYGKVLHKNLPMERSAKNLFLMDVVKFHGGR